MLPNTGSLAGRTLFITGASRGIGKSIALKAARDGANIVIAAKTANAHPKLPGTIYTAAKEIEDAGGKALPCIVDVRSEVDVLNALENVQKTFGGIDILVNNASAIALTGTNHTDMKKFDLMHQINTRGTFMVSKHCIPYLKKSSNPHILNISPPINMKPIWFKGHVAYTMAKYGMSMCILGMAEEFKEDGIACNALWPRTAISTAAMSMLGGSDIASSCRKPEIMADAAYAIFSKNAKTFTGNFIIDDDILTKEGITDFTSYANDLKADLMPDFFLDECDVESLRKQIYSDKKDQPTSGAVSKVFDHLSTLTNADLVKDIGAVYSFELSGAEPGKWFLALKDGQGSCGNGDPPCNIDTTMKMNSDDFVKMFQGGLKPTAAFMSGQLKISGDMGKALKLDKLMTKMKSKL